MLIDFKKPKLLPYKETAEDQLLRALDTEFQKVFLEELGKLMYKSYCETVWTNFEKAAKEYEFY